MYKAIIIYEKVFKFHKDVVLKVAATNFLPESFGIDIVRKVRFFITIEMKL